MTLTKQQALDLFRSDDLIGIGMEANAVRRKLHPEGVATYIIDRNINYTNYCTEYCTFCAFYRPLKGPKAKEGYILDFETIYEKIRETVEMGGTGVLMQGGLHPDLKIDWHEQMLAASSSVSQEFICTAIRLRKLSRLRNTANSASATPSRGSEMPVWIRSPAAERRFSTTKSATRSHA